MYTPSPPKKLVCLTPAHFFFLTLFAGAPAFDLGVLLQVEIRDELLSHVLLYLLQEGTR